MVGCVKKKGGKTVRAGEGEAYGWTALMPDHVPRKGIMVRM